MSLCIRSTVTWLSNRARQRPGARSATPRLAAAASSAAPIGAGAANRTACRQLSPAAWKGPPDSSSRALARLAGVQSLSCRFLGGFLRCSREVKGVDSFQRTHRSPACCIVTVARETDTHGRTEPVSSRGTLYAACARARTPVVVLPGIAYLNLEATLPLVHEITVDILRTLYRPATGVNLDDAEVQVCRGATDGKGGRGGVRKKSPGDRVVRFSSTRRGAADTGL